VPRGLNGFWSGGYTRRERLVEREEHRLSSSLLFLSLRLLSPTVVCRRRGGSSCFLLHCDFFDRNYSCRLPPTSASSHPREAMWAERRRKPRKPNWLRWNNFFDFRVQRCGNYGHMCFTWTPCFIIFLIHTLTVCVCVCVGSGLPAPDVMHVRCHVSVIYVCEKQYRPRAHL